MKAIERDFPIESLSQLAELESWRKEVNRPIYYVHKWWARRLGSVFRAILLGVLLDENNSIWEQFYTAHTFDDCIVLDPFMGSGVTLGEALKLGCRVIGADVNPVAYYMVRSSLQRPDVEALKYAFQRLESEVAPKIRRYYYSTWPETGAQADVLYAFWVKTICCPDCGASTRLFPNWIFAANAYPRRKPQARALCPVCGGLHEVHYQATAATCPACHHRYDPQIGPARRTTFVCETCGREHPIAETYRLTDALPDHQLYALMLLLPDGHKVYKQPDRADLALYDQAAAAWEQVQSQNAFYPRQEIPSGINTDQARSYNYRYWYQMFNARQLLSLSMLLEAILHEPNQSVREQLVLLFSGALEFNNMFCSFKGEGTGAVRPLFSHHILKPERRPLENNPWGTSKSSGSFSTLFGHRLLTAQKYAENPFELRAVRRNGRTAGQKVYDINRPISIHPTVKSDDILTGDREALIISADSASLSLPDGCIDVVVTDPPYFDNVHYSELADFFYVWLKIALAESEPAFAADSTRNPAEVQDTNVKAFERGLGAVFAECRRVLKPDGIMAFTFQHSKEEAWLALAGALRRACLRVVAAYPIKAEMAVATPKSQAKEPINLDVVFVCRPTSDSDAQEVHPDTKDILAKVTQEAERLISAGLTLSRGDLFVIAMSQFVAQCHRLSESIPSAEKQAAALTEIRKALDTLSIESPSEGQPVRQLRLFGEPATYTAS